MVEQYNVTAPRGIYWCWRDKVQESLHGLDRSYEFLIFACTEVCTLTCFGLRSLSVTGLWYFHSTGSLQTCWEFGPFLTLPKSDVKTGTKIIMLNTFLCVVNQQFVTILMSSVADAY